MSTTVTIAYNTTVTIAEDEVTVGIVTGSITQAAVNASIATHNSLATAHGLTADISAALSAAATPSAGNPIITDSAADALIAAHAAAVDPHNDRAYAASQVSAHTSLVTAHGLTADISAGLSAAATPSAGNPLMTDSAVDALITTHAAAVDPHGDRGDATSRVSAHNAQATAHGLTADISAALAAAFPSAGNPLMTDSAVDTLIANHAAAVDPHGDRADTTSQISTHSAAVDPHGDRSDATNQVTAHNAQATAHGLTSNISAALSAAASPSAGNPIITDSAADALIATHAAAVDPHGDRAYADGLAVNYDAAGTASAAVAAHAAAVDPHGDRADAASQVSTHNALATAHGLTANISAALSAAASPSAANPFAVLGQNIFSDRQFIGTNAPSGDLNSLAIVRAWSGAADKHSHAIRDESTFTSSFDGDAYASFDAIPEMSGATHFGHLNCFQARPYYHGTANIDAVWGHTYQLNHTGAGVVDQSYGLYMQDAQGAGPINLQAALFVAAGGLTRGTANYIIYSGNVNTPSYHAGLFQTGGEVRAAGIVSGSNLVFSDARNSQGIGTGVPAVDHLGYYCTHFGYNAGHNQTDDGLKNTNIGAHAGYTNVSGTLNSRLGAYAGYLATGSRGVFIGHEAGYYETQDDRLVVDNQKRDDISTTALRALIYGVFDAVAANQSIRLNAGRINMGHLPTSAAGLSSGDIWNNGGVLTIV